MWRVAGPSEYLSITGGSIKDVKLAKKAWIWPTQKCVKFYVSPVSYTINNVRASRAGKLVFFFPRAVFTIGPRITDHKSLLLYAKVFASHVEPSVHIKDLVHGIIESHTHVPVGSGTVEHISKELLKKFQLELNQFGLVIYNVNLVQKPTADEGIQALAQAQGVYVAAAPLLKWSNEGLRDNSLEDRCSKSWPINAEAVKGACAKDQNLVELESH